MLLNLTQSDTLYTLFIQSIDEKMPHTPDTAIHSWWITCQFVTELEFTLTKLQIVSL